MNDFLILGTDTDAGKTTFALLWLAIFADVYEYWKPVETGDSDSARVRQLVPDALVHAPAAAFEEACAPLLAARKEGRTVPSASALAAARPQPTRPGAAIVLETFGSPLSPLTEEELQIDLIRHLRLPCVLVASSAVGSVGRTLQSLAALSSYGLIPAAIVLVGARDDFAAEQISCHCSSTPVFQLEPPAQWDIESIARAGNQQRHTLHSIRCALDRCDSSACISVADLLKRDHRSVWHPYTSLQEPDPPLVTVAAQDEFLWLADGRKVIDGISSWWTILHGHRHPVLMAALADAMQCFDHVHFAGMTHAPAVELAELLLQTVPWPGSRVFYSDNGSTAVEVALKMAYEYWRHQGDRARTRFIGFEGGYHGDTFGAMAVSRDPVFFRSFEPLLFQADIVPLDADRLDQALSAHRGEVAAVILEPLIQGAGGMRMHSPALLRSLYEVTKQHHVLFIADEVMTGGRRTGTLWAHQAAGIAPDLICAAKTLAGGVLPLAATLASPNIVEAWDSTDRRRTFFHGHSFTAHPLACAVAVANWRMLTVAPNPAPQRMETFWKTSLAALNEWPGVKEVRIRGTIAAIELDVPGGYLADVGRKLRRCCLDHDVLLRPLGTVLYAMPPFCATEASLQRIAQAMRFALESVRGSI